MSSTWLIEMRKMMAALCGMVIGFLLIGASAGCRSHPDPDLAGLRGDVYLIPASKDEESDRPHKENAPAFTPKPVAKIWNPPAAQWSDRPGYVESPFGDGGLIDVRGFAPGSTARDPKSGKIFLVPVEKP